MVAPPARLVIPSHKDTHMKTVAESAPKVKALQSLTSLPTGGPTVQVIPEFCADCELKAGCAELGVFFCTAWAPARATKGRFANASNKLVTCSQSLTREEQGE